MSLSKIRTAARMLLTMDEKDPKRIFEGEALLRRMYRYGLLVRGRDARGAVAEQWRGAHPRGPARRPPGFRASSHCRRQACRESATRFGAGCSGAGPAPRRGRWSRAIALRCGVLRGHSRSAKPQGF